MTGAGPPDRRDPPPPAAGLQRGREAVLQAAAALAVAGGLEGLSVSRVAAALGMSKDSLSAQFGSDTELQLATVTAAARVFDAEVVQPALAAQPGLARLAAVCEAFFAHLERSTIPGGCFMASAALELAPRPGPVKDLIAAFQARFGDLIRGFAAAALDELAPGEDPDRLAFELNGIMLTTDTNFTRHHDPAVLDLARQIVRQRLGPAGG